MEIGKSYKLRLMTNPSLSGKIRLGKITLNFADDFPPVYPTEETDTENLDEYNTLLDQAPYAVAPTGFKQNGYELDGIDLSRFGYMSSTARIGICKSPECPRESESQCSHPPRCNLR